MELKEMITALSSVMSVTGFEHTEKERVGEILQGFDEDFTDAVGNRFLVRRCGKKNAKRVLIDAHFDEIGMMVTEVLEDGFLAVTNVGGLDGRTLSSAEVIVYGKEKIAGVLSSTPPHLAAGENKRPKAEDLLIDTGYTEETLKKSVRVGTPVGFAPRYFELPGGKLCGKGFDNKSTAACAAYAILNTPKEQLTGDVILQLSVHEETDRLGGTVVGGFTQKPDYAMVLDVNLAAMPGAPEEETVVMGKGPSITRSATLHRKLRMRLEELCNEKNIPWQISVSPSASGTNAGPFHLTGEGIPTVDVGLPLFAMHTYNEVIDSADAENTAKLIAAFITDKKLGEVYSC